MSKLNKLKSCLKKKRKNTEPEDYDYTYKSKATLDLHPVKRRVKMLKKASLSEDNTSSSKSKKRSLRSNTMNFDHISKHSSMGPDLKINHESDYKMYFHPREKFKTMPLVIINFEGIIGEILTLPLFDPEAKKGLYLKNGVVDNMKRLLNKFRIALVTSIPQKIFDKILEYIF